MAEGLSGGVVNIMELSQNEDIIFALNYFPMCEVVFRKSMYKSRTTK